MGNPPKRRATYEDLLKVPSHLVAEIIDGELITSPRPAMPHAGATGALDFLIGGPFRFGVGGPGGWYIVPEPELHLHGDVVVPDLAGWRRERTTSAITRATAVELPPDWVCEILSPSTAALDRADKMPIYGRENVGHLWLIDPIVKTLEVFRREAGNWVLVATWKTEGKVRAEPFDAIELDLALLFSE